MKIILAQIRSDVEYFDRNLSNVLQACRDAHSKGAGLLVCPIFGLSGYYSPRYEMLYSHVSECVSESVKALAEWTAHHTMGVIVGGMLNNFGGVLYLFANGNVHTLGNFIVNKSTVYEFEHAGVKLRVRILGSEINDVGNGEILLETAHYSKSIIRRQKLMNLKRDLFYVNQIGCGEECIFDGGSFIVQKDSLYYAGLWKETLLNTATPTVEVFEIPTSTDYVALMLMLRRYVDNYGFTKVVLGLSGGIDSAFVATMAVDALGSNNVTGLLMPSIYTSEQSVNDAVHLANTLGIESYVVSIWDMVEATRVALMPVFGTTYSGITEENLQARVRGNILMAYSNNTGALLLTTGNKSEIYTGYATLYGDMCGGFAPVSGIYKTKLYELAKWRNINIPPMALSDITNPIASSIMERAPTAELRPNQKDEDTLPPYQVLDNILRMLVDEEYTVAEVVQNGYESDLVNRVFKLIKNSEYKRRQSASGANL